jgi:methionyl-tRNA formyltransferase
MANIKMGSSSVILSEKVWSKSLTHLLADNDYTFVLIDKEIDFTYESIASINPRYIFVPHWSKRIPAEILSNWETIIFHMTELPYGRGGSPLQNLILSGQSSTIVSAIKCSEKIDAGDIYCQGPLDLYGSAEEIYMRATRVISDLIQMILSEDYEIRPQVGIPTYFKRRTPEESNLLSFNPVDLTSVYDFIRMLDATGYPPSYIVINGIKYEFTNASLRVDGLHASVRISELS